LVAGDAAITDYDYDISSRRKRISIYGSTFRNRSHTEAYMRATSQLLGAVPLSRGVHLV